MILLLILTDTEFMHALANITKMSTYFGSMNQVISGGIGLLISPPRAESANTANGGMYSRWCQ